MSVQLVASDHYEKLQAIFDGLERQIKLTSPFITMPLTKELCRVMERNPDIQCEIITRFYREDFIKGVSNIRALKELFSHGARIFTLKGLHTKLYLADEQTAMMGSANFTSGGFRFNHELSILLEDEPKLVGDMMAYYDNLLARIQDDGIFELTAKKIDDEINIVDKIRKNRKPGDHNEYQYGADVDSAVEDGIESNADTLQAVLSNAAFITVAEGVWLKFEGTAEERKDPHETYQLLTTVDYPGGITCFPANKKPTGIKDGAYLYLAVLSTDKNGHNTPVIIGRARTYGYEAQNVANDAMREKHPWMDRFPIFIRLYEVEYLNMEFQNGISLLELLAEVGTDTYPSSVNTMKTPFQLREIHYQKSHIRLTGKAKEYLDTRFIQLGKEYEIIMK